LTAFVIACSTIFLPKKTGAKNYDLLCFLTEQMCDLPSRSRIYCSYCVIEPAAIKGDLPELGMEEELIVSAIMDQRASVLALQSLWQQWLKKINGELKAY
jgi:hypothetical protein